MEVGDLVLFYHSQTGNCVMGIMKVIQEAHQEKTTIDTKWVSVTFEPVESSVEPISLERIRMSEELKNIGLIKQPQLAVMKIV